MFPGDHVSPLASPITDLKSLVADTYALHVKCWLCILEAIEAVEGFRAKTEN